MDDQQTCGKGLAEHSTLPATVARLMTATAAILENHQKALVLDDENGRREQAAYAELVEAHHRVAHQLRATAAQMASYRDMPMAQHDPRGMASPESFEAFSAFVALEQELLALLQRSVERDRQMLDQMRSVSR